MTTASTEATEMSCLAEHRPFITAEVALANLLQSRDSQEFLARRNYWP
jgi:hypothetical protein